MNTLQNIHLFGFFYIFPYSLINSDYKEDDYGSCATHMFILNNFYLTSFFIDQASFISA